MGIAHRIELKQQQKLAMSPRMQQAIHVLQLGNAELEAYLEREAEKKSAACASGFTVAQ